MQRKIGMLEQKQESYVMKMSKNRYKKYSISTRYKMITKYNNMIIKYNKSTQYNISTWYTQTKPSPHLDVVRQARGVHPAGHIDGVAPNVVLGLAGPDHPGHHRTDVHPWGGGGGKGA